MTGRIRRPISVDRCSEARPQFAADLQRTNQLHGHVEIAESMSMATVGERATVGTGAEATKAQPGRSGMVVPRVFSTEGVSPFDQVDWDFRTAEIKDERGRVIFQQTDCQVPRSWSQLA